MGNLLDTFLSAYSRESRENTLCLRKLLLDVFPTAHEVIDSKTGTITYRRKNELWLFAIGLHMKHLNLIFSNGTSLADPTGLLSGTGPQARHVKIRSEAETQNPALRSLLQESLKRAHEK
jgi:hypothetical protein